MGEVREVYPGVWVNPRKLGGQPCLADTRMTTAQVDRMMRDYGREFIARGWPELADEQIDTALRYEALMVADPGDGVSAGEFVIPSVEWLAQALCGWHDAESGRLPGEDFPCAACAAQSEYVAEQAEQGAPTAAQPGDGGDAAAGES